MNLFSESVNCNVIELIRCVCAKCETLTLSEFRSGFFSPTRASYGIFDWTITFFCRCGAYEQMSWSASDFRMDLWFGPIVNRWKHTSLLRDVPEKYSTKRHCNSLII